MAWRFVLDGTDITAYAMGKTVTHRLNRPATAQCKCRSQDVTVNPGSSRLKIYNNSGGLDFHGIVWFLEDDGDENTMYTVIQASDPMALWPMRPARGAGSSNTTNFILPTFFTDQLYGPQIMQKVLNNSILSTNEGNMFLDMGGTVATGGVDVSGVPTTFPMTVAEVFNALTDTGQLDVVLTPVESAGNPVAQFNAYNGNYGTDISGSVVFQFGLGSYTISKIRRTQDMTSMCNKLWYYLGHKTADQLRFDGGNITGDGMPPSPGGVSTPLPNPPGGDVDFSNPLGDRINASRSAYWVSMDIKVFDAATVDTANLYGRLWQAEENYRVGPRTLVYITPTPGTEPAFGIGDLIGVQAGSAFRGGITGKQRVYEYTVNITDDGVTEMGEIVASADQES